MTPGCFRILSKFIKYPLNKSCPCEWDHQLEGKAIFHVKWKSKIWKQLDHWTTKVFERGKWSLTSLLTIYQDTFWSFDILLSLNWGFESFDCHSSSQLTKSRWFFFQSWPTIKTLFNYESNFSMTLTNNIWYNLSSLASPWA